MTKGIKCGKTVEIMVSQFQVPAPESFSFKHPKEWPKWIRRFERSHLASGFNKKSSEVQVNSLIYNMGDQADSVLLSFMLSDENKKKYDTVKAKFENYFIKHHNSIYKRAKFNQRKQLSGESVDDFITALYGLVEHCEYGELQNVMTCDCIVVELNDASLAEKLQLNPELTLETAITKAWQSEMVKKQ